MKDFYFKVAAKEITGLQSVNKFGSNLDIDGGSTPETVWSNGGEYVFPSSIGFLSVTSTSDDDQAGGGGAVTIEIQGLDENYKEISETITMNGAAAVLSSGSKWFRIYRALVVTAGVNEVNSGDITISLNSSTVATIPLGLGQTQMAVFTIPAGKKGFLTSITSSILRAGNSRSANISLYKRIDGVKRMVYEFNIETTGDTSFTKEFNMPLVFEEKTDLYLNVSNVSTNNTAVFANFDLVIQF